MRSGRAAVLALLLVLPAAGTAEAATSVPEQLELGKFVAISPPQPAPEISFADAAGNTVTLADFAGKTILVNLWATWCGPCVQEMPSLERLQRHFADRLTVLAISEDRGGSKTVEPFIAKLGLKSVKTYLDPKSTVGRAFKVDGLPASFLIDPRGKVVGRVDGAAEWDSAKMLGIIEPFLDAGGVVKTSLP